MFPTKIILTTLIIFIISYLFLFNKNSTTKGETYASSSEKIETIYDIPITLINGEKTSLKKFKNKTLLIVNVASKCGFTRQYKGLEELQKKYEKEGFTILGVPSDDFMNQEPGSNEDILSFCQNTYQVTFPLLEKTQVKKGLKQHPLYRYLTGDPKVGKTISWNFNKYLVSKEGNLLHYFGSTIQPLSHQITAAIENDLKK